jgi:16S rRNA G966 N2-methylase RsmD
MKAQTDLLPVADVLVEDRVRKDFGDIDELANSIREVGLIQPIVVYRDLKLAAGERRLRAMKKLGITELVHGKTFIFNDELDNLKRGAIECEENLKRKQFTWQEEILAKQRLLRLLQTIHGVARSGAPTQSDRLGITSPGIGVNKLASLLGESNAQTSKDLELAQLIQAVPALAKAETKEAARRQAQLAIAVAGSIQQQAKNPPKSDTKWTLYEGDFHANQFKLDEESVDLILVDPPYGDDAQGMGPQSKTLLASPFQDDLAPTRDLYYLLASATWRALRPNCFSAFFFGFGLYSELIRAFSERGFSADPTPLIWVKNTVINTSPYTRYGRSYEPILLLRKGEPKLIRPAQRDVIEVQNVTARGANETKLYHAQKPVELMRKLIDDLCVPRGLVVDFCAGSGSTGVAAVQSGRRTVLFERDQTACTIIKSRLGAL